MIPPCTYVRGRLCTCTTLFVTAVRECQRVRFAEKDRGIESSWVEEMGNPGTRRNLYLLNIWSSLSPRIWASCQALKQPQTQGRAEEGLQEGGRGAGEGERNKMTTVKGLRLGVVLYWIIPLKWKCLRGTTLPGLTSGIDKKRRYLLGKCSCQHQHLYRYFFFFVQCPKTPFTSTSPKNVTHRKITISPYIPLRIPVTSEWYHFRV